jgi:hypothetical protein
VTAAELLQGLVVGLEGADIAYAIGGSVASMVYGEPRATLDIDVVITLDPAGAERLLGLFGFPQFYVRPEAVRAALPRGGTFNVIQPEMGFKIDFFVVSDAIEERQIARRVRRSILPGIEAWFSPPEELILKKLEYFRDGGSEKHLRDIRAMVAISPEQIDLPLLEELIPRFGLASEWARVNEQR